MNQLTKSGNPLTLSTLEQQISSDREKLAPLSDDDISKALISLGSAGFVLSTGVSADKATEVYSYALSGLSKAALTAAVRKMIRGEINLGGVYFIPPAPALAEIVRAEHRILTANYTRSKEIYDAMKDGSYKQGTNTDPEARERVRAMRAKLAADREAAKARERGEFTPEAMSPEQVAYWEKINSMPDAKTLKEDQSSFRASINSVINKLKEN